jgi:tRNA A-37 threonylcarbamoyl transferase component Bud32
MPDDEVLAIARSRLGRVLRGKYRLDRVLGIGGMAVVYAATHRNKKKFAIKMLHPELSIRENIRTRFLREGYVANSVEHPGAVAVLDDDIAEDGSAFIVMELLEGAPVDEVATRQGKRLPLGLTLSIGDALLDVLVAAHAKRIVHRDLKPANVFLTGDGRLEVLDFGIARLHDATSSETTATGAMLGTPAFMAPEQAMAESSKVDAQTDLWAVGATMFSLLTGEFVHAGDNASQLLIAAGTKPARSLASVAKEVPASVVAVIDKALAFDKAQRWASAQAMREALQKACVGGDGEPHSVAAEERCDGYGSRGDNRADRGGQVDGDGVRTDRRFRRAEGRQGRKDPESHRRAPARAQTGDPRGRRRAARRDRCVCHASWQDGGGAGGVIQCACLGRGSIDVCRIRERSRHSGQLGLPVQGYQAPFASPWTGPDVLRRRGCLVQSVDERRRVLRRRARPGWRRRGLRLPRLGRPRQRPRRVQPDGAAGGRSARPGRDPEGRACEIRLDATLLRGRPEENAQRGREG